MYVINTIGRWNMRDIYWHADDAGFTDARIAAMQRRIKAMAKKQKKAAARKGRVIRGARRW